MRKKANRKVMKAKHSNKNETPEITQKKKKKGEINDKNGMVKRKNLQILPISSTFIYSVIVYALKGSHLAANNNNSNKD